MMPPKYKFYAGKLERYMYLSSDRGINDSGETVSESGKYSSSITSLRANASVFINLVSLDSYNAIFFYDSSQAFISYKALSSYNNQVITPPVGAAYYAIRFTTSDANFDSKKGTNFVYTVQPVNPHYKELNKKYAKENSQEFFRISLDGKINLFGQDYELVANSNLEDQHIFLIDKYNRNSAWWTQYYKGEFSKTDCKFDHARKKCELKISPIDEYSEVMNKYENTYDLIKLAPETTKINLHKRPLVQVYVLGANSVSNFFGGTYWEDDVNEAINSHDDMINKYYFGYIKAGNEFYIDGAGIAEVNGVYAGTNGNWDQWNGHVAKLTQVISAGDAVDDVFSIPTVYAIQSADKREASTNAETEGASSGIKYRENLYKLQIVKNSTEAVLYESEWLFYIGSSGINKDNIYIARDDIKMVNTGEPSDTFVITNTFVYHIYQRLLCDVDSVESAEGTINTYNLPSDDFVVDNRNYKKCIGLIGGLFFCSSRAVDKPTRYGKNDYGQYFTNQFISLSTGLSRPLPISRNSWANASLWYVYESYHSVWEASRRKQYTLKDSYSIAAVIKALLSKIDPTLKHEATAEYSRFLYDEVTPLGMARFYVYMTQKTNILKGDYDQPAQKAETSLAEITKMLRDCFRCYWYIEDGKFKIEHIFFFIQGGAYSVNTQIQLDFTRLTDQFNKKQSSYFQSEIEYDKTDLAQRYEFNWMDDATELFGGVVLDVNSNYVQKDKTEEVNASQFSSDVDYMLFNPSAFSEDGFVLLCPIKNNDGDLELPIITTELFDENGDNYEATAQNWYASWIYLTAQFYRYDMPAPQVQSSALGAIAASAKKCMKHTIEVPIEEDLDELKLIKTEFGNGKIDEFSINFESRQTKVKLTYSPK